MKFRPCCYRPRSARPRFAPPLAQDWPTRPVKAITTTSAGGLSDIFMRALGEELRQQMGPAADHREPPRRRDEPRHPRLRGFAARRLHHLHHQRRCDALQPVPVQDAAVQSRNEPAADHQRLPPDPHAGGEFAARREDRRRALRAVEGEGRHAELSRARRAAGALHGDAEEGEGLRLGARAVPRRRRGGQRDHERLDADRRCSARATSSATSAAAR